MLFCVICSSFFCWHLYQFRSPEDSGLELEQLLQAESALEGNSKLSTAEKNVGSSLQALKDGDMNGAINHVQEAKSGLSSV